VSNILTMISIQTLTMQGIDLLLSGFAFSIRTNLRKTVTSAMVLTQTEDVLSRLLGASSDDRMKKEVIPAIVENDVDFIQVLILKRMHYYLQLNTERVAV